MKAAFADTGYWIGLLAPRDLLHAKANALASSLRARALVTTEMVLAELLNDFAARGLHMRRAAALLVRGLPNEPTVRVVPQTPSLFSAALDLYEQRPDKEWSLTDCASIVVCQEEGITEVLTHDQHFVQAGLRALMREP